MEKLILGLIVFVPLLGAGTLPLMGRVSSRLRNNLALGLVLFSFVLSLKFIPLVLAGNTPTFKHSLPLGFNFILYADSLAVFMAMVSALVSAVIIFYSFDYISHYENQNEYYALVVLFLGAMQGIIFSANLIWLYLFWEITAICSWRLIGFFRERMDVLRADKAFLVTVFGALVMFIGFVMLYQQYGSLDLAVIKTAQTIQPVSALAVGLILVGIFSKSATLPFHTWLPDAGVAPSPVTALLHAAVLVKIGVYVYARLLLATFILASFWQTLLPWVAAASAIISAGAALIDTDIKRIIAYSTISQIAFIFFGLSMGNEAGIAGGMLYILMHGLSKAGLFLCAGIIEQNTKSKDIRQLGGLIKTMPFTALAFLFCSFSVMGIPPFGGFFSKYLVFSAALSTQQIALTLVFLAGAILTILYLFRLFYSIFLGDLQISVKEKTPAMVFSVGLLALLSLAAGVLIYLPLRFADFCARQMLGKV